MILSVFLDFLGRLAKVKRMYLALNDFHGPIPPSYGNLTEMRVLNFDRNNLTGTIPDSFRRLYNMQDLSLVGNPLLGGPLPEYLKTFPDLVSVNIKGTNITVSEEFNEVSFRIGRGET